MVNFLSALVATLVLVITPTSGPAPLNVVAHVSIESPVEQGIVCVQVFEDGEAVSEPFCEPMDGLEVEMPLFGRVPGKYEARAFLFTVDHMDEPIKSNIIGVEVTEPKDQ